MADLWGLGTLWGGGGVFLSVCATLGLTTSPPPPPPLNWEAEMIFLVGVQMLKNPIPCHLKS